MDALIQRLMSNVTVFSRANAAYAHALVQVLLNGQRWHVQRTDPDSDLGCDNCGRRRQALCISPATNKPALCPACALGGFDTAPSRNGAEAAAA